MQYKGLFKSKYQNLEGRKWILSIDKEDVSVFVSIGQQAADHGKLGGYGLVQKRGKTYMKEIGRRGAIMTNIRRWFDKAVQEEHLRLEKENVPCMKDF